MALRVGSHAPEGKRVDDHAGAQLPVAVANTAASPSTRPLAAASSGCIVTVGGGPSLDPGVRSSSFQLPVIAPSSTATAGSRSRPASAARSRPSIDVSAPVAMGGGARRHWPRVERGRPDPNSYRSRRRTTSTESSCPARKRKPPCSSTRTSFERTRRAGSTSSTRRRAEGCDPKGARVGQLFWVKPGTCTADNTRGIITSVL